MKINIKSILIYSIGSVGILALIGFSGRKQMDRSVNELKVDIGFEEGNYFIDQFEVVDLVNAQSTDYVLGLTIDQLSLKDIEHRVEANAFVKDAQVFTDIKGNLKVLVTQTKPIARIFGKSGTDRYIDEEGRLIPLNARHTARVPILELERKLPWELSLTEDELGRDLLELLKFIEQDPFWRPQIAHLVLDRNNEIEMLTQVSKQEIIFGKPEKLENKFKNLKLFYKEILPNKGWNTYSYVNVKFENQIVCK